METSSYSENDSIHAVEATLDRVDELMSAYLDDALTDESVEELNGLITGDSSARERCLTAATLHADLIALFQEERLSGRLVTE